ncbi:MFS general substrate transporter [Lophium mytilinum]|uniref:MFS general substrate transporter n=1 Tax=Lophium mytilinum TaxID=390894 RepID=A0A6A6QLF3_9PEZI|nr:MFS general substrate transporter [Lophium mytilinum]
MSTSAAPTMPSTIDVDIPTSTLDFQPANAPQIERINVWLENSPSLTGSTFGPESPRSINRINQRQNRSWQGYQEDRIQQVQDVRSPGLTSVQSPISKTSDSKGWTDIETGIAGTRNTTSGPPAPHTERRSWKHILAGMAVLFNCWGVNLAYGVFQEYYVNWMLWGMSQGQVAWVGSTQLGFIFLLAMPVGKAFDLGYFRTCFFSGAILLVGGQLSLSACTNWRGIFLTQGVVMGAGSGLMFVSGILYISSFYGDKLDIVMSMISLGAPLGGIVYTVIAQQLLRYSTFKTTCWVFGGIMTGTMIPAFFAFLEKPNQKGKPKQIVDLGIFGEPAYMLMCLGMAFSFWGLYIGFYFIIIYAIDVLSMYPLEAANFLTAMLGVGIVGRLFAMVISRDLLGPLTTLIFFTAMSAAVANLWMNVGKKWELYFVGCLYGLVSAGVQGLFIQTISAFIEKTSPTRGFRIGVVLTAIGIGALTGAPLGGWLAGIQGPFPFCWTQVFAVVVMYAGLFCFLGARYLKVGWSMEQI